MMGNDQHPGHRTRRAGPRNRRDGPPSRGGGLLVVSAVRSSPGFNTSRTLVVVQHPHWSSSIRTPRCRRRSAPPRVVEVVGRNSWSPLCFIPSPRHQMLHSSVKHANVKTDRSPRTGLRQTDRSFGPVALKRTGLFSNATFDQRGPPTAWRRHRPSCSRCTPWFAEGLSVETPRAACDGSLGCWSKM